MEAARDALDGAVAALFASPHERTDDATHAADGCVCGCPLRGPDAWRALRDFPVLARWIVTTWQRHAETLAPITQKKTRRAGASTSSRTLELRVASLANLCMRLYQCGVLASEAVDDTEVVAALLQVMATGVFPRVLQHRMLSFNVRFRLMQYALASSSDSVQEWMEDVCVALQQELRDKSAQTVGHNTPTTRKTKKRSRESMSGEAKNVSSALCDRCVMRRRSSHGTSRRRRLANELAKWIELHQSTGPLGEVVSGLCTMLNAPDVVRMLDPVVSSSSARQQGRGHAGRASVVSSSARLARSLCDKIVESTCHDGCYGSASMWRLVWRRESGKVGLQTKLSMEDVVVVCAIADLFTRQVSSSQDASDAQAKLSIGLQVVINVMHETPHQGVDAIRLLHAIRGALHRSLLSATSSLLPKPLRSVLINYVRQLFEQDVDNSGLPSKADSSHSPGRQSRVKADPQQKPVGASATISDLMECLSALHEVVRRESYAGEEPLSASDRHVLFELWHGAIRHLSCQPSSALAPPWTMFMAALTQCCEELKTSLPPSANDFEAFVSSIATSIIVSNGTRLYSPGSNKAMEIPADESNRSTLEAMLAMILSSTSSSVVAEIVCRVIAAATRSEQINGWLALFGDGGGVQRLLFPSLAAFITGAGPEAVEPRFSSVMSEVYNQVKRQSVGYDHVRALAHVLCGWDSYCERTSSNMHQEETRDRQGMQIALQLRIWEDFVRLYASDARNRLRQEPHGFPSFLMRLLRSVDAASCPAELEGSLFSVLSAISTTQQHSRNDDDASTTVTHTNATVTQLLSVFTRHLSAHRCKELLDKLLNDGKLEDLVLSLRRWLGVLAASPQSLPKETRTELIVVANRLVFHCRENADVKNVQALLTPVDPVLIAALQAYSCPPTTASSLASATPTISIVRLSLIVRSYFETACVPDLLALTTAIADSLLTASTPSSRDGLLKLAQGYEKVVITEIIVEKLHDALLLVGDPARTRTVDNALAIIAPSQKVVFRGVMFSNALISMRTTERWLPVFLIAGLVSDSAASLTALTQAETILDCIEHAVKREERDEDSSMTEAHDDQQSVLSHAYALVALLSTVEQALLRVDSVMPIVRRVQDLHAQLRVQLEAVREKMVPNQVGRSYLVCTALNQSGHQDRGGQGPSVDFLTSGRVCIDSTSAAAVQVSDGVWQRRVNVPDEEIPESMTGVRFFLPFGSWLRAASRMPRHQKRQSENVFVDTVLQFYLPVEFYGDTSALTAAWIDVWIARSLSRARCIELSALHRKLLLQLLSCDSPWPRLIECAQTLLDQPPLQVSIPRDTVMTHIVDSLDLTTLCVMRPSCHDASRAMASDITTVLQQALSSLKDGKVGQLSECLRLVTPLLEVFVRVGLESSSSGPVKSQDVVVDIEARFAQVRSALRELLESSQDSADADWCRTYWLSLVARWKRVYSHLNRSHASRLFTALHTSI